MNVPRYAAAAAKLLARHVVDDVPLAAERERGIETIERAMQRRSRQRRLWRGGGMLAAAAALALLWLAAARAGSSGAPVAGARVDASPLGRGATLRDRAGAHPLGGGTELRPDQTIETAYGGGASLRLSTGTRLELAGRTSFRIEGRGESERFTLARGELSARVAKLGPGQRFVVETPDAEVEVRGTVFRLVVLGERAACGAGSRTRLEVTEGMVEVRSARESVRVGQGERWPRDCPSREPADTQRDDAPAPAVSAAATAGSGVPHAVLTGKALSAHGDAALKRQNDLFAEAVASAKRGDRAAALSRYEELIRSYPRSPLAENALIERMRLVLSADPESGRTEARRYLLRYPHGFAAEEAERVLRQR